TSSIAISLPMRLIAREPLFILQPFAPLALSCRPFEPESAMAKPILPRDTILDALPVELSRAMFAKGRDLSLAANQTLFLAGDEGEGCYRVEEGLLKASVAAPNGGERILAILGPGAVVGELSMIDNAPRSASVSALRDSTLRYISRADFDGFGQSRP